MYVPHAVEPVLRG